MAEEYRFQILAMEVMPEHIHLLVNCNPQLLLQKELESTEICMDWIALNYPARRESKVKKRGRKARGASPSIQKDMEYALVILAETNPAILRTDGRIWTGRIRRWSKECSIDLPVVETMARRDRLRTLITYVRGRLGEFY